MHMASLHVYVELDCEVGPQLDQIIEAHRCLRTGGSIRSPDQALYLVVGLQDLENAGLTFAGRRAL